MTPSNFRNFFRRNSDREGRQQAGQQQDSQQQAGEEQVGQPRQRRNSQDGSEDDPGRAARATASPEQPTAARHSPRHSPRAQRQRAMARRQPSRQNGPPAQGTGEHTPPLVAVPQGTRPGAQRQMVTHIVEISAEGANNSVFNRRTPRNVQSVFPSHDDLLPEQAVRHIGSDLEPFVVHVPNHTPGHGIRLPSSLNVKSAETSTAE